MLVPTPVNATFHHFLTSRPIFQKGIMDNFTEHTSGIMEPALPEPLLMHTESEVTEVCFKCYKAALRAFRSFVCLCLSEGNGFSQLFIK